MIKHVVMWTLKDQAEGASKAENAGIMKERLEALAAEIDEIKHIEVGINLVDSADAWDVVLYSEFDNLEDIDRYLAHPAHQAVGDFVKKIREKRASVDYEA